MSERIQPEPEVEERSEQPYIGVTGEVTMTTIGHIADRIGEIFGWLGERGIEPIGGPFFRYHVIDMERKLVIEAGVPVASPVEGDGDLVGGVLPAGRYATVTHHGHPDQLIKATEGLLAWAADRSLTWDRQSTPDGEKWGCRLETYLTDPAEEPDMNNWETELAFRLAD